MKKFRLLTVVLLVILCAAVYAGDVCSVSTDGKGNMKIRAGLAIDGSVHMASPGAWYFLDGDDNMFPFPGSYYDSSSEKPDTLVENGADWACAGRWFVTAAHDKSTTSSHYTDVSVIPDIAKSINNGIGMDLTPMVTSATWSIEKFGELERFVHQNVNKTVNAQPAGKFCMFRVRVTDNGGQNERYYWVGDSGTGQFTYCKEWINKNFVNMPERGKYGEYADAVWNITSENIDVYIKVNTLYDQARFEINIVNNDVSAKYVSVAMYGASTTTNDIGTTWGTKPYIGWKERYNEKTLLGWTNTYEGRPGEDVAESNKTYFYIPGLGTVTEPTVLRKESIPNRIEMYNYRWTNANVNEGLNAGSRVDADLEDEEEIVDSTYNLPPKSSYINVNSLGPKSQGNSTAFQSVAQATFDNSGDATKPDYLIIDNASNMLQFTVRNSYNKYPFGNVGLEPDDGNFPTETYWPGAETGVNKPYEDTLDQSRLLPYEDSFIDPMAYMAVWGSKLVSAGDTRQIVTYYGIGGKSFINGNLNNKVFSRQSHSLFVESPATLGYTQNDALTGIDNVSPNEFVIRPIIANQGAVNKVFDFTLNKVSITLPEGLELADDSDGDGGIFVESETEENTYEVLKNVSFFANSVYEDMAIRVKANGLFSGNLTYTVKIYGSDKSGGDEWCQKVSRDILVPTTKTGYVYGGPGNLVAAPYKDLYGGETFTVSSVYGDDAMGFAWDPVKQEYYAISNLSDFNSLNQGFWILKSVDEDSASLFQYTFPTQLKPKDVDYGDIESVKTYMAGVNVSVKKSWNIVSNPYIFPMQLNKVLVKNILTGDIKNMADAVDAGWISKTMFSWEPEKDLSGSMIPELSKYKSIPTLSAQLIPNKGYWMYCSKDLELYFEPALYPNTKIYDDEWFSNPDKYFMMGYRTDENYE